MAQHHNQNYDDSKKFHIKAFNWVNGELHVIRYSFDAFEETLFFAKTGVFAHLINIYDDMHRLVHKIHCYKHDTYA